MGMRLVFESLPLLEEWDLYQSDLIYSDEVEHNFRYGLLIKEHDRPTGNLVLEVTIRRTASNSGKIVFTAQTRQEIIFDKQRQLIQESEVNELLKRAAAVSDLAIRQKAIEIGKKSYLRIFASQFPHLESNLVGAAIESYMATLS